MLVTCEEMQTTEREAFSRGVTAAGLMENAGLGIAEIVRQFHSRPGSCVAFCGKGNNAGDALVALRHLKAWGWEVFEEAVLGRPSYAELPARHHLALDAERAPARVSRRPLVLLDGLLGIGARGEPRGAIAAAVREINRLRAEEAAWVLAIDVPTGLDGDTGKPASCCVAADLTATIASVKQGLVADDAANFVGRLAVVPLCELPSKGASLASVATAGDTRVWLPARPFDVHKGDCGRIGIIAGSRGLTGAARMCSAAAVRAGAGLVTLLARPEVAEVLAAACVPEVMVKPVDNYREALAQRFDVIAIGPGLGLERAEEVVSIIRDAALPMVVDADALNALARDPSVLRHCRGPRLLTPHPGEMERLCPRKARTRRQWVEEFATSHGVCLLLKGSRTLVGAPDGALSFNTTGNPGMASGGMGDVLTGVCAALAAQCHGEEQMFRSGVLGAWLCGRAAEIAVFAPTGSPEALSASCLLDHLGQAFSDLRSGVY